MHRMLSRLLMYACIKTVTIVYKIKPGLPKSRSLECERLLRNIGELIHDSLVGKESYINDRTVLFTDRKRILILIFDISDLVEIPTLPPPTKDMSLSFIFNQFQYPNTRSYLKEKNLDPIIKYLIKRAILSKKDLVFVKYTRAIMERKSSRKGGKTHEK